MKEQKPCEWAYIDGLWNSKCGNASWFDSGTPEDNGFQYCPYCGLPLEQKGGA